MATVIDPGKAEVPILPHNPVLLPINNERGISCLPELLLPGEFQGQRNGFPTQPVAREVRIAVEQRHAHTVRQDSLQIRLESRVRKIPVISEAHGHGLGGGAGVVDVDAEGLLHGGEVEIVDKVVGWGGVVGRMADVVGAAAGERGVDVSDQAAADVGGGGAHDLAVEGVAIGGFARVEVVGAAVGHVVHVFHEGVDRVVDLV